MVTPDRTIKIIEENNPNDKFSVKLVLQRGNPGQCVGHVPIEFSNIRRLSNTFIRIISTGLCYL
jgi:hypothetical protein